MLTKGLFFTNLILLLGLGLIFALPNSLWGISFILLGWLYGRNAWPNVLPHTPIDFPLLILAFLSILSLLVITADVNLTHTAVAIFGQSIAFFLLTLIWAKSHIGQYGVAMLLLLFSTIIAIAAPFITDWAHQKILFLPDAIYETFPTLVQNTIHSNTLASLFIVTLPLALAGLFWQLQNRTMSLLTWFMIAVILPMLTVFLLTQSRGGYIVFAFSFCLLLFLFGWRKIALALIGLTISFVSIFLWYGGQSATTSTVVLTATDTNTFDFRLMVWEQSLNLAADFPFTGVGFGAFNAVSERLYPFPILNDPGAHNLYLQIMADLGIPALIAYLSILGTTFFMAYLIASATHTQPDTRVLVFGLVTGLVGLHLHGLLDNTLWSTRIAFVPFILIGLITAVFVNTYRPSLIGHNP